MNIGVRRQNTCFGHKIHLCNSVSSDTQAPLAPTHVPRPANACDLSGADGETRLPAAQLKEESATTINAS